MGIIINDTITLNNGLTASTIYCSFGEGEIRIEKNRDNASEYDISGHYTIWVSKDFRINDKPSLDAGNISLKITSSDLNSNIYTLLYNELKTKYTSATDEL